MFFLSRLDLFFFTISFNKFVSLRSITQGIGWSWIEENISLYCRTFSCRRPLYNVLGFLKCMWAWSQWASPKIVWCITVSPAYKKASSIKPILTCLCWQKKRSMHSLIACMWTFPLKISPEEILAWFAVYPGHLRSCKDFHYIQKPELNHFCLIRSWKQDIWRKKEKYLEAADTHKPSTVARKNKKISDTLN